MTNDGADHPSHGEPSHGEPSITTPIGRNSVDHRCVCGQAITLEGNILKCPQCGRTYDPELVGAVGADTVSIDSDQSSTRLRVHADHDPLIGQRLGHFTVLSRIGDGGMGAVYYALDESLQRHVALKVICNESDGSDNADLDRLFREARAQARVNHPHVVHVYFVGKEGTTPFLAMEYVGDSTLSDRMRQGPIEFPVIIRYALQITRALACAAEYDIVHGDIKPSNVLLDDHDTAKLSDFGLARRLSASATVSTSSTSPAAAKISGTPDYMSPEATVGRGVDHRGDIYSLGVTLFEMTFARLPYTASSNAASDRLRLHRESPVEFPEPWPTELPESWKFLLARMLNKEPRGRPSSFEELESQLQQVAPTNVSVANPILRGIAWILDSALLIAAMVVIHVAVGSAIATFNPAIGTTAAGLPQLGFFGSLLTSALDAGFLIAIALLQAHWGNTTGKRFLQILIVDQHGLKPARRVLAARTFFQFSWAWWLVIRDPMGDLGFAAAANTLGGIVGIVLVAEAFSVLLRQGRSIHDSLFGTRVVLDAPLDSASGDL